MKVKEMSLGWESSLRGPGGAGGGVARRKIGESDDPPVANWLWTPGNLVGLGTSDTGRTPNPALRANWSTHTRAYLCATARPEDRIEASRWGLK